MTREKMIKKIKFLAKEAKLRIQYKMAKDCIFCKIVKGEIKSAPVYQTDTVMAINDINPVAASHVLIFPKRHIDSVLTVKKGDGEALEDMFAVAQKLISERRLEAFRLAFNGGRYQHVPHLHMHLVAGSTIKWSQL
ncbi:MAG: HIT domain-containing protein [Candidatus Curtissbacteria bacterium]|nr:HIT domain-containing protein [Candidatus Curtissbacteria bacterium]